MKLRITYNAPVVLTFAILAVGAFVLQSVGPDSVRTWFAAWPQIVDIRSYVGMFTHILGHESWQHLLSNFMLILLLGPILEERHGSGRLLVMILVTALVTGLATLVFSSHPVMGASGVAFMMILLASMANVRGGEIPLSFILVAVIYMGGEIVASFRNDQISHMAHLVGGTVGAVFGFLAAGKRNVEKKKPVDVTKLKLPAA